MSFTNFSSSNSIIIGDLTKEELFSKDHKFYENYQPITSCSDSIMSFNNSSHFSGEKKLGI